MIPDSGPKPETKLIWLPVRGLPEAQVVRPANGRRGRRRYVKLAGLTAAELKAAELIAALVQK